MSEDRTTCPDCGAKIVTRTTRRGDKLLKRERHCKAGCGYEDFAIVKPAEIVEVVCTHRATTHKANAQG
jgi:hypothetical protein